MKSLILLCGNAINVSKSLIRKPIILCMLAFFSLSVFAEECPKVQYERGQWKVSAGGWNVVKAANTGQHDGEIPFYSAEIRANRSGEGQPWDTNVIDCKYGASNQEVVVLSKVGAWSIAGTDLSRSPWSHNDTLCKGNSCLFICQASQCKFTIQPIQSIPAGRIPDPCKDYLTRDCGRDMACIGTKGLCAQVRAAPIIKKIGDAHSILDKN